MIKRSVFYFALLCIVFWHIGCQKDPGTISTTPELEFVGITPSTANEYIDDITITVSYIDGDGDLGENDPDVFNLFVTDTRNDVEYKYRIPELSPQGSEITIKGELNISINGTSITDGSSSQNVIYDLYITDRAGNRSKSVSTSPVKIVK